MNAALDKLALLASADLSAADVALRQIPNDDPNGCFVPLVLNQIRNGKAFLCEIVLNGNEKVGFTIYTIDDFGDHREFVSIATCTTKNAVLRFQLQDLLLGLAKQNHCKTIRMHTCRHGLVSDALRHGWHTAEIVLRKSVI